MATKSLAEQLASDPKAQAEFLDSLSETEAKALEYDWSFWGRPKQQEPPGDWSYWIINAGRGFGKTRTGAEWIKHRVENGARRIALIGETVADVRDTMVRGPSGILAVSPPWNMPVYQPSTRSLRWPNGAVAFTYSAEKPDQLRGPEHDTAWGDELAKWRYVDAWDQLLFGMRRPDSVPKVIVTTTPRPTPIIKELLADPLSFVTRGSTSENKGNLSPIFIKRIFEKYAGTRLGRQELEAEVLDDAPGALWKRDAMIEAHRVIRAPRMSRIVVAIDPSVSADSAAAETGIVAAGLGADGHAYVLADASVEQPTPEEWGKASVTLYHSWEADCVVGEVNNGGDLVESNVRSIEKHIPFKQVRASRGKDKRAEPISSLYEQGKVHHVGTFAQLEDQMCQWEPRVSTWSPNRVDALVWALTELMFGAEVDEGRVGRIKSTRR